MAKKKRSQPKTKSYYDYGLKDMTKAVYDLSALGITAGVGMYTISSVFGAIKK